MAKKGRIVNVASVAGHLKPYKEPARSKLQQSTSSVRSVLDLVEEYKVRLVTHDTDEILHRE
jgi:hypothetical protein